MDYLLGPALRHRAVPSSPAVAVAVVADPSPSPSPLLSAPSVAAPARPPTLASGTSRSLGTPTVADTPAGSRRLWARGDCLEAAAAASYRDGSHPPSPATLTSACMADQLGK